MMLCFIFRQPGFPGSGSKSPRAGKSSSGYVQARFVLFSATHIKGREPNAVERDYHSFLRRCFARRCATCRMISSNPKLS